MKRLAAVVVSTVMATTLLSGCGGNAYCDAVKDNEKTLNSFGKTRTNAAYTKYAATFRSIAKVAPDEVKKDWTDLAKVAEDVLTAQKQVGIKLDDMSKPESIKKLSNSDRKVLNTAYKAFNATSRQRTAVVKNVKQECKITLK